MRTDEFHLQTRRAFLGRTSMGFGSAALASLLKPGLFAARPGITGFPNYEAKIKRVIFLCMAGGPAHLELLDHKPELEKRDGEPMPESVTKGQQIAQLQGKELRILAPQHPFKRYGASGQHMTSLLPHIGGIADDICIVRSLQTEQINHDTAHTFMNTGNRLPGRPSMGSWITYGLGSESEDLPGFVVLTSEGGAQGQPIAARQWHSGFLPGKYQGVKLNSSGDPVNYVRNPKGVSRENQSQLIDTITRLNRIQQDSMEDPEISTRISQYELAFRMQMSVPDLVDFSQRAQARSRHVRHQGRGRDVCVELLTGPALGRARGSLHPFVSPRVGSPRRNQEGHDRKLRLCRSRLRGTGERPKRSRHAQRLADPLVRRVRPHAHVARRRPFASWPRSPHQRLFHVDGRRRDQRRHQLRRDG